MDHALSPLSSASDLIWTWSPLILSHHLSPLSPPRPGVQEPVASTDACRGGLLTLPTPCLLAVCEGMCVRAWGLHAGHCSLLTSSIKGVKTVVRPHIPLGARLEHRGDCWVDPLAPTEERRAGSGGMPPTSGSPAD